MQVEQIVLETDSSYLLDGTTPTPRYEDDTADQQEKEQPQQQRQLLLERLLSLLTIF